MITGEQVKTAMIEKNITHVKHHECGLCSHMVYYSREGDQLFFHPHCGCVSYYNPPEPCEWEEAADWINTQSNDEVRSMLAARFGLDNVLR
ncbi:MAG: hypothetical protein AB2793_06240 [Candidatus Thiodiazotropha sp.]